MAETDQKVMEFVEDTLKKNPRIQLSELFERAKVVDPAIGKLSKRQFNARYPLQVKRRKAQVSGAKVEPKEKRKAPAPRRKSPKPVRAAAKTTPRPAEPPRDAVRQVFLQFATDIAGAEERKQLVTVLANVDRYVNRVLKTVSGS